MALRVILSNFFQEQWIQNHPQYLSGLLCALFPATFLEIAVYTLWLPAKLFKNNNDGDDDYVFCTLILANSRNLLCCNMQ